MDNPDEIMRRRIRHARIVAVVAAVVALIAVFVAYRQTGLLLDFVNLRYCG